MWENSIENNISRLWNRALSLFSIRRNNSREQRKKKLDWLATDTYDITTQSHSSFACSREKTANSL
jgi:hypothetical protein